MKTAVTSRKNKAIAHFRSLASDRDYRRERREFLCEGGKLLLEALASGARVISVLAREDAALPPLREDVAVYSVPAELLSYASRMDNPADLIFSCAMPVTEKIDPSRFDRVIILDGLQDPGNVGTIIRTADAFSIGLVALTGPTADPYNPKTVRATMGAVFRQKIGFYSPEELRELRPAATVLSPGAEDIRAKRPKAVVIGSEGSGISPEMLRICSGEIMIPMSGGAESLNAAAAAAIVMWEMVR
ncbi:MAG: TrmH family RNA methyltransferase [Oscillospiraceae bacterium]|jgi:TrmH family RNA methyltransferase